LVENIGIGNAFGLKSKYTMDEILRQITGILVGGIYGEPQLGGTTWFLRVLFFVSVMFWGIQKIAQYFRKVIRISWLDLIIQWGFAIGFLTLGWTGQIRGIGNKLQILTSLSIYFVYVLGYTVKRINVLNHLKNRVWSVWISAATAAVILAFLNQQGSVAVNTNTYTNPPYLVVVSCLGCILCTSVALLLGKTEFVSIVLSYLGRNSLYIFLFHFLAFKLITCIEVVASARPSYLLAAFPILFTEGFWRIAYILTGLIAPLLVSEVYKKITIVMFTVIGRRRKGE